MNGTSTAPPPRTFGGGKRWGARFHLAAGTLLAFYNLFLANLIAFRHPYRIDLTAEKVYTLSQETREKLEMVGEPISILYPYAETLARPEHHAYQEVLRRTRFLLEQYMASQPLIRIAGEVDVFREPARWEKLRQEYGLSPQQVNRFILVAGPGNEFRQSVNPTDLARFQPSADPASVPPRIAEFRGEAAITAALVRLIRRERKPVYFTQDHEEMALGAEARPAPGAAGLNAMRRELETEGFEPRPLSLGLAREVPADAAALVLAGPAQPFRPEELESIERYLRRGGRLFVALGPRRTGIEDLLKGWGVGAADGNVKVHQEVIGVGRAVRLDVPIRTCNPEHPVTRSLADAPQFEAAFHLPRPLSREAAGAKGFTGTALLTARTTTGETFFVTTGATATRGDFELAIAVEQRVPERPPPGFQRLDARLVVTGASNFLGDGGFTGNHRDFFLNALLWLAGMEETATRGGVEWAERTLKTDPAIRRFLFLVPVFLLPGIFLALGTFVYFLRRS